MKIFNRAFKGFMLLEWLRHSTEEQRECLRQVEAAFERGKLASRAAAAVTPDKLKQYQALLSTEKRLFSFALHKQHKRKSSTTLESTSPNPIRPDGGEGDASTKSIPHDANHENAFQRGMHMMEGLAAAVGSGVTAAVGRGLLGAVNNDSGLEDSYHGASDTQGTFGRHRTLLEPAVCLCASEVVITTFLQHVDDP